MGKTETRNEATEKSARPSKPISQWGIAWRRFKKNKAALVGLFIEGIIFFMAIFGPFIAPFPPNDISAFFEGRTREAPSWGNLMGTDYTGHDVFSQVIYGASAALQVGVESSLISMAIAILVGSIAGYYGGMIDTILMRFSEIFLVMPSFLFLIVFLKVALTVRVAGFGLGIVILVLGIIGWAGDSRAIRAEFMRLKEFEFVTAARCLGASNRRIISNHILPNVLHLIIVLMTASIATNIIIEAGLSFLGFSDPNIITWGRMISLSMEAIRGAWWQGVFPGLAIVLTVLGFNLLGDGLRDALDPRLRE